jgi:hypothetical protein
MGKPKRHRDQARPALPTDAPLDGPIYVGEAILWLASLGHHLFSEEATQRWDEAQRQVLKDLSRGAIAAEGVSAGVHESIPPENWAPEKGNFNLDKPPFGQEPGGVLRTSDHQW